MAGIPESTLYRWTTQDFSDAHVGKTALTPYQLPPSAVTGASTLIAGDYVELPLGSYKTSPALSRFSPGDDLTWEEVPPGAADQGSLADVCSSLKGKSPKYVDRYYDVASMSLKDRHDYGRLLFEHWDNTDYRYAVIQSGKFSWTFLQEGQDTLKLLPAKATYKSGDREIEVRLKRILVRRPEAAAGAAAPGKLEQAVVLPDPALSRLDADLAEIRSKVARLWMLLKQSEQLLHDRLMCAARFTALRTLLETCANATRSDTPARGLAMRARTLEKQVNDDLKTLRGSELLPKGPIDYDLGLIVRKNLGFADDLAAEVKRLADDLCHKLAEDTGFAGRCGAFARDVITKKLASAPGYVDKRDRIILALVETAEVLQQTAPKDGFTDALVEILKRVPDEPITSLSGLNEGTALDALFSLLGTRAPYGVAYAKIVGAGMSTVTSLFGNLAGPPSAYIAWVQLDAWNNMQKNFDMAVAGNTADVDKFLEKTFKHLERGLKPDSELRPALEAAFKNQSQKGLLALKRRVLDEYSGTFQATSGAKVGALALQVVGLLMAYAAYAKDNQDSRKPGQSQAVVVADVLGLVSQGEMTVVGLLDVIATVANAERLSRALGFAGMRVGTFAAALGLAASAIQLATATDTLSRAGAAANLLGSLATTIAGCYWLVGTPIPYLQMIGMALLAAGGVLGGISAIGEASKSKASVLALLVIDAIQRSPFYLVLATRKDFHEQLEKLKEDIDGTSLPLPARNDFVYDVLLKAGFRRDQIDMITAPVGAPLLSSGMLSPQPQ